jgi:hypothetical protein
MIENGLILTGIKRDSPSSTWRHFQAKTAITTATSFFVDHASRKLLSIR